MGAQTDDGLPVAGLPGEGDIDPDEGGIDPGEGRP